MTASLAPTARASGRPTNPFAWIRTTPLHDIFFKALLLVAPIQSVLLTPVQGTTPAFVLVLMSMALLASGDRRYYRLWLLVIGYFVVYSVAMAASLSAYFIDQPDISQIVIIRDSYVVGWLRQSNITQGLYLLIPVVFLYLVYNYYQESFVKYAFYGILFLAFYGIYEFIFYAIFKVNGDFLSNRSFGDLESAGAGAGDGEAGFVTGSLLQTSNLFGAGFMRLKSLVGEPSMYALTVTPFAIYAIVRKWWLIASVLMLSLVLGSSTTAIVGLVSGIGYVLIRSRQEAIVYILCFIIIFALLYFTSESVKDPLDRLLFDKLSSGSGNERTNSLINHAAIAFDGNFIRTLFGLGFGTARSTDMFSNLLANVGVVGLLAYSAVLLTPCFMLKRGGDSYAIVGALISIFVMEMVTVSEYAYLPPWFMVALGYVRVRQQRRLALPSPEV